MFKLCLLACVLAVVSADKAVEAAKDWNGKESHWGCTGGKVVKIVNEFSYFNTGSATGCEHRHHYLYDYQGSDCVWTSDLKNIKDYASYDFQYFGANFKFADHGAHTDYQDHVKVELRPCTAPGACGSWGQSVIQKGKKHGWYWKWVTQRGKGNGDQNFANGDGYSWLHDLDPNHKLVQVRITLSSKKDYERYILDNLNLWGWGCKKGSTVKVNCVGSWTEDHCTPPCGSTCSTTMTYTHSKSAKNGGAACSIADGHVKEGTTHAGAACPTSYPTKNPTKNPTKYPTKNPTKNPTDSPTAYPTSSPTTYPTPHPTAYPTSAPTTYPTPQPTAYPTSAPTTYPTPYPTAYPTSTPTTYPTPYPTSYPTSSPTAILAHAPCKWTHCTYKDGQTLVKYSSKYPEKWHCEKNGAGCKCVCHSSLECALRHHHTSGYKKTFEHC